MALTLAGSRVHWVGVDISGLIAAMQSIGVDGSDAREDRRFGNGFQTMRGNSRYLFFARDSSPATVLRESLSNQLVETVGMGAQGVSDFVIDETRACWTEPGSASLANGRVRCVLHDSDRPDTVAEALARPVALAQHRRTLFVLAAGTMANGFADGRIVRIRFR